MCWGLPSAKLNHLVQPFDPPAYRRIKPVSVKLQRAFKRLGHGKWISRYVVTFTLNGARHSIVPGTMLNRGMTHQGLDIAALLDEAKSSGSLPPGFRVL